MGRPKFCKRCRSADSGDGIWTYNEHWDDDFLDKTSSNVVEFGKVLYTFCPSCKKTFA